MPQIELTHNVEDKMDLILVHLDRMDRRDRLRMYGSFFRSMLSLIPIVILVWSTWYFFAHSDQITAQITDMAAKAAQQNAANSAEGVMQQAQNFLNQQKK